jgi:hypothetical protein
MKSQILIVVLAAVLGIAGMARAEFRVLIDFGPSDDINGRATASPDVNGNYWNSWRPLPGGTAHTPPITFPGTIVDTANNATSISLTETNSFDSNGRNNGGLLAPDAGLLGDFAINTATEDYWFESTGGAAIRISGLEPGLMYNLRMFGTRESTSTRITRYTVTDANGDHSVELQTSGAGIGTGGYDGNNDTIVGLYNLMPTAAGELYLDVAIVTGGFAYLGILEITAILDVANNPDPFNKETLVLPDSILSWEAPEVYVPVGYNVYIGTDPNVAGASQLNWTNTTIEPATDLAYPLLHETTYYWRVDSLEPNIPSPIIHKGALWSFSTAPAEPLVTGNPVAQTVTAGTMIDLSVTALNVDTYTWYRSVDTTFDPVTDTQIDTGSTISVAINGVEDEGYYYCVVSNDASEVQSEAAQILTKRLVGWWPLDGDLTDAVSTVIPGAVTHDGSALDPNFVDGVAALGGQGYQFYGDGRIITIADSTEFFNFYPRGMTISCWVKNQNPSIWDTVCSKEHERESGHVGAKGFYLGRSNAGAAAFAIRPFETLSSNNLVTIADWHQLTGVYDPVDGVVRIYLDGLFRNEVAANSEGFNVPNLAPLIFGAESTDGTIGSSNATIDDVKIYSYALNSAEIAQQYVDVAGGYVCIDGVLPAADLSGDCQVNLDDFAILAEHWLDTNRAE